MEKRYANHISYSDVHAHEVIKNVSDKCMIIKRMHAELDPTWKPEYVIGGFAGHCTNQSSQRWLYTSDDSNPEIRIRLHKNGQWKDKNGNKYSLSNKPREFRDYNY